MTDLDKMVELLSGVQAGGVALDHEALKANAVQNEEVADYLIANGVTVREMQRPLTVDELMDMPGSVWYENDTVIAPMMVSNRESFSVLYLKDVVFGWYRSSCVDCFASVELPVSDYGKTWRCWANRPTEEERKAAEWLK